MTSLEGGAGVGSGLWKGYKWPPPSAALHRGPAESCSAGRTLLAALPRRRRLGAASRTAARRPSTRSCEDYRASGRRLLGWSRAERRSGRGAGGSREPEDRLGRRDRSPARSAGTGRAGRVALTMVRCGDAGVLLCALLGGLLLTGEARRGHPRGPGHSGRRASAGTRAPDAVGTPGAVAPSRAGRSGCAPRRAAGRPLGGRGRWPRRLAPGPGSA